MLRAEVFPQDDSRAAIDGRPQREPLSWRVVERHARVQAIVLAVFGKKRETFCETDSLQVLYIHTNSRSTPGGMGSYRPTR